MRVEWADRARDLGYDPATLRPDGISHQARPIGAVPDDDLVDEALLHASEESSAWLRADLVGHLATILGPDAPPTAEALVAEADRLAALAERRCTAVCSRTTGHHSASGGRTAGHRTRHGPTVHDPGDPAGGARPPALGRQQRPTGRNDWNGDRRAARRSICWLAGLGDPKGPRGGGSTVRNRRHPVECCLNNLFNLVIENSGATVARDVRLSFTPPLESSNEHVDLESTVLLTEGIPMLPPGRQVRAFFDAAHDRKGRGLPMHYDVEVALKDYRGRSQEVQRYVIDLEHLYGLTNITEYGIHDAAKALREIQKSVKK